VHQMLSRFAQLLIANGHHDITSIGSGSSQWV